MAEKGRFKQVWITECIEVILEKKRHFEDMALFIFTPTPKLILINGSKDLLLCFFSSSVIVWKIEN